MVDSGFQRAVRAGKPHHTNTFQVSTLVMFAIVPLAKGSHMAKSKVKVGGNYPSALIRKGKLLQLVLEQYNFHAQLKMQLTSEHLYGRKKIDLGDQRPKLKQHYTYN